MGFSCGAGAEPHDQTAVWTRRRRKHQTEEGSIIFPSTCEETTTTAFAFAFITFTRFALKKRRVQSKLQTVRLSIGPNDAVSEEFQHEGGGSNLLVHGVGNKRFACAFTRFPLHSVYSRRIRLASRRIRLAQLERTLLHLIGGDRQRILHLF
jgi:hypothetical protein